MSNPWTKGHRFAPVGNVNISDEMMSIKLTFAGWTKQGSDFVVEVGQALSGWTMAVSIDGTYRGTYESTHMDLSAAVIDAIDRFA